MYEEFYKLREIPFSMTPDPEFLYLSEGHQRALSILEYGLLHQLGFTVITGAIGSGKTTLVRRLLHNVAEEVTVGMVSNSQCNSFDELLRWILLSLELEYRNKEKVELFQTLTDFLVNEYASNRRVVVIIDEAQHLGPDMLEQLRMLSNVNADKYQLLQLILVGQPDLWETLRRPELLQFAQRISAEYDLKPLSLIETRAYIQHRLFIAGGDPDLFTCYTYEPIWEATGGIPRLINLVCDTALVYGFGEQLEKIGLGVILHVVEDKKVGFAPIHNIQKSVREEVTQKRQLVDNAQKPRMAHLGSKECTGRDVAGSNPTSEDKDKQTGTENPGNIETLIFK